MTYRVSISKIIWEIDEDVDEFLPEYGTFTLKSKEKNPDHLKEIIKQALSRRYSYECLDVDFIILSVN